MILLLSTTIIILSLVLFIVLMLLKDERKIIKYYRNLVAEYKDDTFYLLNQINQENTNIEEKEDTKSSDLRKDVIQQPEYWLEKIKGELYNLIDEYKEQNNLSITELAKILNISETGLSMFLTNQEYDYTLKTYIHIVLKLGKIPKIEFKNVENEV